MVNVVSILVVKALGPIRHHSLALRRSDCGAKIGLWALAEDTAWPGALRGVAWDDMITWLNACNSLADAFDDTASLVTQNTGEETFRIVSIQGIYICVTQRICNYLDTHLAGLGWIDGDCLEGKRLFGRSRYHGLASDGFSCRRTLDWRRIRLREYCMFGTLSLSQPLRMEFNVIVNERGNEPVRMIIVVVEAEGELLADFFSCFLESPGLERLKEFVVEALVDENIVVFGKRTSRFEKDGGVMLLPGIDGTKIGIKGFLPESGLGRITEWS